MPQLPAGWEETTLGEVVEIVGWWTPKTSEPQYWNWNIPWLSVVDFNNDNRRVYYTEKSITEEGLKNSSTKILNEWDLIISARWTVWALAQLKRDMAFNQSCYGIKQLDGVSDKNFLFYLLKNSISFLSRNVHWAVFDTITRETFDIIPIHLPPLPEQQAIAAVLSSFDDKIELLRAENQTLEQMGQELFKERFGKWKVGDELPEGCRVGKLGEIISLQWWFVHNINLAGWEKTKIAKMWVVDGKVFFNRNSVIWYPDIIPEKYKLEEWDLIICTRDVTQDRLVIWNVALVPDDLAKFWLYAWSNTWIVKTSFYKLFLFLLFRSRNFRNHIIQSAKGSTIVMITQDAFLYTNIIIPDQETLSKFDLVIKPLFNKIKQNSEQIQTLSATRDQLLPKLMSGEVRVEF